MAVYYIHLLTCHPKRLEAPDGHKHYSPKIKKTMKKAKTISLRLTEQENYWLKALARQSGKTQSEVIRSLIKNGHVKERISRDTLVLLRNLLGEATNLNQLARQANAYGFGMIADDCRNLTARISQIVKQIKDDRKDN
ncbi:bacterial mobilization protein MobC [Prevotella sp. MSX73]|nr:bacterial mobilization protein MobC [Prevotella sp. MSX73]